MNNEYKRKISLKFNKYQLEQIIRALLDNGFNGKFINNTFKLFGMLDEKIVQNDYDKEVRVFIIHKILNIIVDKEIKDRDAILSSVDLDGKFYEDATSILNDLAMDTMTETELLNIDKLISSQLKFGTISEESDKLIDLTNSLNSGDYENFDTILNEYENTVDETVSKLKEVRESVDENKNTVNLNDSSFVSVLNNIIHDAKNPAAKIKTGIQALNKMLNGGWEKGRLYTVFGVTKGWKSGFLLNNAIYAKKYNNLVPEDQKKQPVILYLTLENQIKETTNRLLCYCFNNDFDISKYSAGEITQLLTTADILTPNDPNSAEIQMRYMPNKSISALDINVYLDELEKENKECVFLIVDYLARLKSNRVNKELRLELSDITNELSTIAKVRNIPVLTASQLNRDAIREVESECTLAGKIKASSRIGTANAAESINIVSNSDVALMVNRIQDLQFSEDGNVEVSDTFLTIKMLANRGQPSEITEFRHLFLPDNGMRLDEDINDSRSKSIFGQPEEDDEAHKRLHNHSMPFSSGPRKIQG